MPIRKLIEKPKRPMSSFILWLNSNRDDIKRHYPGFSVQEIARKGGEIWRGMVEVEKNEWVEMAAQANRDYIKACARFKGGKKQGRYPVDKELKMKKRKQHER